VTHTLTLSLIVISLHEFIAMNTRKFNRHLYLASVSENRDTSSARYVVRWAIWLHLSKVSVCSSHLCHYIGKEYIVSLRSMIITPGIS
jgi:hypothetical protein